MLIKTRAYINPVTIQFKKNFAKVQDHYSEVLGVHMVISKKYFDEYEVDDTVDVSIPYTVYERLNWGFKTGDVSLEIKDNKIFLDGAMDNYDTDLDIVVEKPFPFKMKPTESYGILPSNYDYEMSKTIEDEQTPEPLSVFEMDISEFQLPPSRVYNFEFEKGKLSACIVDAGNFKHKFIGTALLKKNIKQRINGEYYNIAIGNLSGLVKLVLDKNMFCFVETSELCAKTIILGTRND